MFLKYALEGLAVALAAFYIPQRKMKMTELAMVAATAGVTFMVLDLLNPEVGESARLGSGFGIGKGLVEPMCGSPKKEEEAEGMCGACSEGMDY